MPAKGVPAPIIVRFMTHKDQYRVISEENKLKSYNEDKQIKVYINEDLTATRAQLFAKVRKLQKNQFFKQVWTFDGNIKVTHLQGHVKTITNLEDVQKCLPIINIGNYFEDTCLILWTSYLRLIGQKWISSRCLKGSLPTLPYIIHFVQKLSKSHLQSLRLYESIGVYGFQMIIALDNWVVSFIINS